MARAWIAGLLVGFGLGTAGQAQEVLTPAQVCTVPGPEAQAQARLELGLPLSVVKTEHFTFYSDCSPRCRKVVAGSAELFYRELKAKFLKANMKPVTVYYLERQETFRTFMATRGHERDKDAWAIYYPEERAVYAHRLREAGGDTGIGTIFCVVVDPAVDDDFPRTVPLWFAESFSALFQQARFVGGRLRYGCPQAMHGDTFAKLLEERRLPSLERFVQQSDLAFRAYQDEYGNAVGRTIFTFLQSLGEDKLQSFIDAIRAGKSGVTALQIATKRSIDHLEKDWREHVVSVSLGCAWVSRAADARPGGREILEEGALRYPRYGQLLSMLAQDYLNEKRMDDAIAKARAALEDPLFNRVTEPYQVLGACYFDSDPDLALEFYKKAIDEQPWHETIMGACYRNYAKVLLKDGERAKAAAVREELAGLEAEDRLEGAR